MKRFTANYMWNFRLTEESPVPRACMLQNERYTGRSNIVSPAEIDSLVVHFQDLQPLWSRIPHWIIKADLGRLLYIYFNGNFYFDVDCAIRKGLSIKAERFLILFTEMILKDVNQLGPRECKNPENVLRIANYAFGTNVLRHPFLKEVILECINRLGLLMGSVNTQLSHQDILWVCGPDVITTVFHQSRHRYPDLILMDTSILAHLCHGSWRD